MDYDVTTRDGTTLGRLTWLGPAEAPRFGPGGVLELHPGFDPEAKQAIDIMIFLHTTIEFAYGGFPDAKEPVVAHREDRPELWFRYFRKMLRADGYVLCEVQDER
jgi:hypothetical protein